MGYSRQVNQKMIQLGKPHPDRDAQFQFINRKSEEFLSLGLPVISVDCKKKENLGNFKNNGQEYRPKGEPRHTYDHDWLIKELGKVAPYGVYVLNDNTGFVNVGQSADTAEFAGESISRWWHYIGEENGVEKRLTASIPGVTYHSVSTGKTSPAQRNCMSFVMVEAAMAVEFVYGNMFSLFSRNFMGWRYMYRTFRPGLPNGTK